MTISVSEISGVFGGHRVCWASLAPVGHGGEVAVEYWWRHDPGRSVWRDGVATTWWSLRLGERRRDWILVRRKSGRPR